MWMGGGRGFKTLDTWVHVGVPAHVVATDLGEELETCAEKQALYFNLSHSVQIPLVGCMCVLVRACTTVVAGLPGACVGVVRHVERAGCRSVWVLWLWSWDVQPSNYHWHGSNTILGMSGRRMHTLLACTVTTSKARQT